MNVNKKYLKKGKESNFIIISKEGIKSPGNNKSFLTLKEGAFSLKISLNDSIESKIDKQRIINTIADIKNHIKDKSNKNNITKNNIKIYKININKCNKKGLNNKDSGKKNNIKNCKENTFNSNNVIKSENDYSEKLKENSKKNKELSSIIIADEDKLSENDKENINEIENNFKSSINKKSIRTQFHKKDKQKSMQQSDRAELSKFNSESDNITEFDNKLKNLVKFRYDSGQLIKGDINEKEEYENELIDNDNITIFNNNKNEEREEKEIKGEKIILNQKTMKKNNFFNEENIKKSYNNSGNSNECKELNLNNNKQNIFDISKDNRTGYSNSIVYDNISENKNLIPLNLPSINQKRYIHEYKDKDNNDNINDQNKSISLIKKQNTQYFNNSILISSNRELNTKNITNNNNGNSHKFIFCIQKNCFICEKLFILSKLISADCGKHLLCHKCAKNYYEDYIENKNNPKILKCPNNKCNKKISYDIIKTIISETHQRIYELMKKGYNINNKDLNDSLKFENDMKIYSEKHVLEISSNINFYLFKKSKDLFCPKCLNPNLFSRTSNCFIKCLNCNYKICKFCLKPFTNNHLNIKSEGYCKVYFRRDDNYIEGKNYIFLYSLQLIFVIAMYLFTFCGTYLLFYNRFKKRFKLNNKRKKCLYYIKKFFVIIFSIILLALTCPFILACYPFFPLIIAICDY